MWPGACSAWATRSSAERQPVGAQGVQRAIASLQEGAAVEAALGYEPGQPAEAGWQALNTLYELSNYQFNAHGVELGYRYRSDAIVDDDGPEPVPARDPQLYCAPLPGQRAAARRRHRAGTWSSGKVDGPTTSWLSSGR